MNKQQIVGLLEPDAFYPPVAVSEEGDWFVCANGHRWDGIRPEDGCSTCKKYHEHRAKGRPDCSRPGCGIVVTCNDRAWEAGVRECEMHWREDRSQEWNSGPICLDEFVSVLGEYSNLRWNGWLMPYIDAWSCQLIIEKWDADMANIDAPITTYEWQDDLSLKITERDGDEEFIEILEPDEDGLYALGAGSWIWSEDPEFGATEEWQAWSREGTSVAVVASNENNRRLIEEGVDDRHTSNRQAGEDAYMAWLKDNPEPPMFSDGRTSWDQAPGEKVTQ